MVRTGPSTLRYVVTIGDREPDLNQHILIEDTMYQEPDITTTLEPMSDLKIEAYNGPNWVVRVVNDGIQEVTF